MPKFTDERQFIDESIFLLKATKVKRKGSSATVAKMSINFGGYLAELCLRHRVTIAASNNYSMINANKGI